MTCFCRVLAIAFMISAGAAMTDLRERVEVTQADKDAARSIEWVSTTIDNHESIAQAFARHRLQSRASLLAELAEPSQAMLDAAIDDNGVGPYTACVVWQAMLAAYLEKSK